MFSIKERWRDFTTEQRIAVCILSACGLLAVGLSVASLKTHVVSPFFVSNSVLENARSVLAKQQQDANALVTLKTKDTDHDGLSDYDELYVYHTSPYLADSDSDGIPDAIEIAQGADPNCPQGKTCFDFSGSVVQQTTTTAGLGDLLQVPQVPQAPMNVTLGENASSTAGAQAFLQKPPEPGTLTPAEIRNYLISNHMVAKEQLDLLPDDKVVEVYNAAYQEALRIQAAGSSP